MNFLIASILTETETIHLLQSDGVSILRLRIPITMALPTEHAERK